MAFRNIATKVGIITSTVIVLFGVVTCFLTYSVVYRQISTQSQSDFISINEVASSVFAKQFNNSQSIVKNISIDSDVVEFMSQKDQTNLAENLNKVLNKYNINQEYSAIYLTDVQGITVASTDKAFIGQDYSFRQYFQSAVAGIPYTDVNYGVTSQKLGVYFSHAILDATGKTVGVAVAKLDPSSTKDSIVKHVGSEISDLLIVDRYGVVVEAYKTQRVMHSMGKLSDDFTNAIDSEKKYQGINIRPLQYQAVQEFISKNPVESRSISVDDLVDGKKENLFVSPINGTSFYLVSEVGSEKIAAAASKVSFFVSAMIGLAVVTTSIILWTLLSNVLSPIAQLHKMATDISQSNFDITNPVKSKDELFALGQAIELMAKSLRDKYTDLETLVAERTKSLELRTKTLSRSQLAIQNLLEDTNQAKVEAEKTVIDLEKFQKAVDGASDHIVITDPEGIILYANPAVTSLTGYSHSEVIGKKAGNRELWGGLMPTEFYEKMWKTIKVDKSTFCGEINNRRKNGQKYISIASISPILSKEGEVVFYVGIERDATVEREVDRMKTEFVSFASHQLRTPLSAMKWFAEMLLAGDAGKLSKDQKEFVQNIYDSNERMVALVKDLLDISRIESGRIIIDPVPTDIAKLAKGVLLEVTPRVLQKKQKIISSFSEKLPLINLDPNLVRNVFMNLLTNAIKYTPEKGEIIIFISKKGKEVVVQVSDNGFGIPKAQQTQTFGKFFRASNAIKRETEGTGLGLYIVKSVVESSGGKVWFKSHEGEGTTFWFSLPIKGVPKKEGQIILGS